MRSSALTLLHSLRSGLAIPRVVDDRRCHKPHRVNWATALHGHLLHDSAILALTLSLRSCVLTHQLPFQTYLATYFVFVDFCLLSQYAYYSTIHPSPPVPPLPHPPTPRLGENARHSYIRAARSDTWSSSNAMPGSSRHHVKRSSKSSSRRTGTSTSRVRGAEGDPISASWLSEGSGGGSVDQSPTMSGGGSFRSAMKGTRQASAARARHGSPELAPAPLERRGRSLTRPAPAPPKPRPMASLAHGQFGDLETIAGSPSGQGIFHTPGLQVAFDTEDAPQEDEVEHSRHRTRNTSSSSRPPSRRTTSMVFLSVGVLAGFRWVASGSGEVVRGRAWSTQPVESAVLTVPVPDWRRMSHPVLFANAGQARTAAPVERLARRQTFPLDVSTSEAAPPGLPLASFDSPSAPDGPEPANPDEPDPDEPWYPQRNWERFVGRASAWLCTSLYLTSRLPQIWQNVSFLHASTMICFWLTNTFPQFRRRSVEGLSMMLFVMGPSPFPPLAQTERLTDRLSPLAFVGNSLYVLSILTNPLLTSSPGFLLESTPYLMGSGGTVRPLSLACIRKHPTDGPSPTALLRHHHRSAISPVLARPQGAAGTGSSQGPAEAWPARGGGGGIAEGRNRREPDAEAESEQECAHGVAEQQENVQPGLVEVGSQGGGEGAGRSGV